MPIFLAAAEMLRSWAMCSRSSTRPGPRTFRPSRSTQTRTFNPQRDLLLDTICPSKNDREWFRIWYARMVSAGDEGMTEQSPPSISILKRIFASLTNHLGSKIEVQDYEMICEVPLTIRDSQPPVPRRRPPVAIATRHRGRVPSQGAPPCAEPSQSRLAR